MTVKTISGNYPSGFTLSTKYSGLVLTKTATVEGSGVNVLGSAYVQNYGTIAVAGAAIGLYLNKGGTVVNELGAAITGSNAIQSSSAATATVINNGSIGGATDGIGLSGGGFVINEGTIFAGSYGVIGAGSVTNDGSIVVEETGVGLVGGSLTNFGLIGSAFWGVRSSGAATVLNYGSIGAGYDAGVYLQTGGTLVNGGGRIPGGVITAGGEGVEASAATVRNYGTIVSNYERSGAAGVVLTNGATLSNGAPGERSALIEGYNTGLAIDGSTSRASNFGTIECTGGHRTPPPMSKAACSTMAATATPQPS